MWKKSLLVLSLASVMFAPACKSNNISIADNFKEYEFSLSKATINWMWDGFRQNFSIALSEFNKNESGLSKLPIEFKNTLAMKNSYIYLDEEGISTLKTGNFARSGNLKVVDIKGKIIKTHSFYNWLELMFTSPPLPEKDNEQALLNQLKN
ncbi:hypothetical protein [Spiroplasma endosymbiont of Eupeodes luniger]|uniref:hypothetical protein n=1 Tax=Spiroplasma endosymbiont of Eupeodes luniger TaxID=3066300 RepID=UPI0030CC1E46